MEGARCEPRLRARALPVRLRVRAASHARTARVPGLEPCRPPSRRRGAGGEEVRRTESEDGNIEIQVGRKHDIKATEGCLPHRGAPAPCQTPRGSCSQSEAGCLPAYMRSGPAPGVWERPARQGCRQAGARGARCGTSGWCAASWARPRCACATCWSSAASATACAWATTASWTWRRTGCRSWATTPACRADAAGRGRERCFWVCKAVKG